MGHESIQVPVRNHSIKPSIKTYMSLLKKLKNKKERMAVNASAKISKGNMHRMVALEKANSSKKPQFTKEQAEGLKSEEYNNVFKLSNASYILLQRYAQALDNLMCLRDRVGRSMSKEDALKVYYFEKIIEAIMTGDEHIRSHHIIVEDGVCEMDNAHHAYFEIISQMDKMNDRSLFVLNKAAETINTSKRYMWLESEADFKNNMQMAIQHGIDIAMSGRKKATLNDVDKFLESHSKENVLNKNK